MTAIIYKAALVVDVLLRHLSVEICKIILDAEIHIRVCDFLKDKAVIAQEVFHNLGVLPAFFDFALKPHKLDAQLVSLTKEPSDFIVKLVDFIVCCRNRIAHLIPLNLFISGFKPAKQLPNASGSEIILFCNL